MTIIKISPVRGAVRQLANFAPHAVVGKDGIVELRQDAGGNAGYRIVLQPEEVERLLSLLCDTTRVTDHARYREYLAV